MFMHWLLDIIESSYFGFDEEKPKGKIPEEEKYRAFRVNLDVFMERIDVVYGSDILFKAAFPDHKYHPSNGVTLDSDTGIYNFPILKGSNPVRIIGDVLEGAHKIVSRISESKGIENNETEAYMFGYICSNILPRIIDYKKLCDLEKHRAKKDLEIEIHGIKISFHIRDRWKDRKESVTYEIERETNVLGSCLNRKGSLNTHILIKPNKTAGDMTRTSVYTHELYHMYRRLYPHLEKYYKSREDMIRELVRISYPCFISYIERKRE